MKHLILLIIPFLILTTSFTNVVQANGIEAPLGIAEDGLPLAGTYSEYKEMVKGQLSAFERTYLIPYDIIQEIDNFSCFKIIKTNTEDWPDFYYQYILYIPQNNHSHNNFKFQYEFTVFLKPSSYFEYLNNLYTETDITLDDITDNMTRCTTDGNQHLTLGNIHYYYSANKLWRIAWENDTHVFTLFFDGSTFDDSEGNIIFTRDTLYLDPGKDTFLSKILSLETAEQTIEQLNKTIERRLLVNWLFFGAVVVLLVAGTVILLFVSFSGARKYILRRKAKEKAMLLESCSIQNEPPTDSNELAPKDAVTDNIS